MKDSANVIYRPYITLKNGRVIWASQYGLKAFRIPVGPKPKRETKS